MPLDMIRKITWRGVTATIWEQNEEDSRDGETYGYTVDEYSPADVEECFFTDDLNDVAADLRSLIPTDRSWRLEMATIHSGCPKCGGAGWDRNWEKCSECLREDLCPRCGKPLYRDNGLICLDCGWRRYPNEMPR